MLCCEHLFLYNRCCKFLGNNWSSIFFCDNGLSHFLGHSVLVLFVNKRNVFLVDDLLLFFMNDWDVFLVNVFLVDYRLNVLMDHRSMMLMDYILMEFIDYVLMMLMDYLSVRFFDDWLFNNCFDNGCFLMGEHLGLS